MKRHFSSFLILILSLLSGPSVFGMRCASFVETPRPAPREISTRHVQPSEATSRSGITPGFKISRLVSMLVGFDNLWGPLLRRAERKGPDYEVDTFHVTIDSNIVVTHTKGKIVEVYDKYTSKRITTIPYGGKTRGLTEGVLSVSGDYLVVGRLLEDGRAGATLFDKDGTPIMSIDAENQPIRASLISADQRTWIIARERSMEFYDISTGNLWTRESGRSIVEGQIQGQERLTTAAISTNGKHLFVATHRNKEARVMLFNITGRKIEYIKELTRLNDKENPGIEGVNPIIHIYERTPDGIHMVMAPEANFVFDARDSRTFFIRDASINLIN